MKLTYLSCVSCKGNQHHHQALVPTNRSWSTTNLLTSTMDGGWLLQFPHVHYVGEEDTWMHLQQTKLK
jgi:hypothetical protein